MTHKKQIPEISRYMSTNPHSIGIEQPLSKAIELMKEYRIRHLPVLSAGKLLGIISDRDLKFALSLKGVDATQTPVGDIACEEVYSTHPHTPLDEVLKNMARGRLGSAVITDNGKLVGIFTAVDAIRTFDEFLETKLAH
jgi:acetoin utilization protein AcuB